MRRKLLLALAALLVIAFFAAPSIGERQLNKVVWPAHTPSARAKALHARLRVADLHADSLMSPRDLSSRGTVGHVDLPRLREGKVVLQGLGIVTKVPRGMRMDHNDDKSDVIGYLAIGNHWPPRTWNSVLERALYQTDRAAELQVKEGGHFVVLKTRADVHKLLSGHAADPTVVGGVLGIEGAHALEGQLANLDLLFDRGVRTVGLAHFFDNEWAGSAHGMVQAGLTPSGRELVAKLEAKRITIDLAHASKQTFLDVLAIATRPVIVSHTGVLGTCKGPRNLSDDQLRAVAKNGGLVGIGFWNIAVCGTDPASIARAILYAVSIIGAEHVALGSDFDGAVTTPFDASGLVYITDSLLAAGVHEDTIKKVMGENVLAFWAKQLP